MKDSFGLLKWMCEYFLFLITRWYLFCNRKIIGATSLISNLFERKYLSQKNRDHLIAIYETFKFCTRSTFHTILHSNKWSYLVRVLGATLAIIDYFAKESINVSCDDLQVASKLLNIFLLWSFWSCVEIASQFEWMICGLLSLKVERFCSIMLLSNKFAIPYELL